MEAPDNLPRTSNNLEAGIKDFVDQIGSEKSNLWKAISSLQKETTMTSFKLNQIDNGEDPRKLRWESLERMTRVENIVEIWSNEEQWLPKSYSYKL